MNAKERTMLKDMGIMPDAKGKFKVESTYGVVYTIEGMLYGQLANTVKEKHWVLTYKSHGGKNHTTVPDFHWIKK